MNRAAPSCRTAIVVIAKEPAAGTVKTRLIPAFGAQGAARCAAAMLGDTLAAVRRVPCEHWLCFAPPDAGARLALAAPGFKLLAQRDGDLGDRLAACLRQVLAHGARRVVIVGADTPQVPVATYRQALAMLASTDVVLGPALDGGYYLVGASAPAPGLFTGVPMGTDAVLRQTLGRAAALGLGVGLLPALRDLDRVEDLRTALVCGELAGAPRTSAVATDLLACADVPAS